jgi:CubicO group peptidase (beta-lactamase class C family)
MLVFAYKRAFGAIHTSVMNTKFLGQLGVVLAISFSFSGIASGFHQTTLTQSNVSDVQTANRMVRRLVELFNANDHDTIRSLATDQFSDGIPKQTFQGMIQQIHSLGILSSPELILDLGEQRHYRLTVKQDGKPDIKIVMVIGVESVKKYFSLGFERYDEPIVRAKPFATDNRKKTATDRAVQLAIDRYIKQFRPVGISIAVFRQGKESFYNYGEVTAGKNQLPTSQSTYEIGSITKTMTGILLGQAALDRKLKLDDDIRHYLPGAFPNLEFEGRKILIRDLVSHTSGLPANPPGIPDDGKADAYEAYNHSKLLADLASIRLSRKPGTVFSYSNMGAGIAGLVLENAFKTPYETLLQKYVLGPAKMKNTGIKLTKQMEAQYATPYDAGGAQTERWIVNGIESAGAVHSNAQDMLRYARFNTVEKQQSVKLSHQKASPNGLFETGFFWVRSHSRAGGEYINHEGGTGGFSSDIVIMPKRNLAVVVMMNSSDQKPGQISYEIALRILNAKKLAETYFTSF